MTTAKADKKCIVCDIDLNTLKGFRERVDWASVRFCSSKCRKAATLSTSKRARLDVSSSSLVKRKHR